MITDISQLDLNTTYTFSDYLKWQLSEQVELIKGKISRMSPAPSRRHQGAVGILYGEIYSLLRRRSCKAYVAPFDVRFPNDDGETYNVVQPDICVICDSDKLDDQGCVGAPDIVVEILSPSTAKKDLTVKYDLYEEQGVKEYWVVFPDVHIVEIFAYDEKKKYFLKDRLGKGDSIKTEILPGLDILLDDVFEE